MKAFEFDHHLIDSYGRFSRSFSSIRAEDLRSTIDEQYDSGRFWPDALLSLNPRYLSGPSVDELVSSGELNEATGQIFRFDEGPLRFHRHQAEAIAKAKSGKSYVVTTGTGSGKSLCFFVPIVDSIVRALQAGQPRKTRAIIIYPMNALANSQIKEIHKFIDQSGLPENLKPMVRRYTGQEGQEERQQVAKNPPDILLTNYMMAELLLTRQDELDSQVIGNAVGLEYIVLDELHTYRGRQGADVAVLVRRLRERCTPDKAPICIGTSATMSSEGSGENQAQAVATVATRLFGLEIGPESVIGESLQRATDPHISLDQAKEGLPAVLNQAFPETLNDDILKQHPLTVWAELVLGLDDKLELKRKKPIPFEEAARLLADDSALPEEKCRAALERFLTLVSLPEHQRGGFGDSSFLAFKLHRFISGASEVFTVLTGHPRKVLFEGQLEDPEAPGHRLYPTRFCRSCGQEYHVVTKVTDDTVTRFLPRNIDDTPLENEDEDTAAGYLCPVPVNDPDFIFTGEIESFPESWREEHKGGERIRANRKQRIPEKLLVTPEGKVSAEGRRFWFLPGKFAFCLCCQDEPSPSMRERSKLASLSGEGRSSATTLLVSSSLEWMNNPGSDVPETKRKLLGFTDNRQDAALQSGHFNDFLFVSLLRGAILRALLSAGEEGMTEDEFGLKIVKALQFTASNKATRVHWMLDPAAGAVIREDAQRALAKVLAYRVWIDLRRGWRYTNPSLSVLNLLDVEFAGLDDIASDTERWALILPELRQACEEQRKELLKTILSAMLEELAVSTETLDLAELDGVAQKSRSLLRSPWAIDTKEKLRSRSSLLLHSPGQKKVTLREEQTFLRAGHNSRIARMINRKSVLGVRLKKDEYVQFFTAILEYLAEEGLLVAEALDGDATGWRLTPSAIRLVPGKALTDPDKQGNPYFHKLYLSIADGLAKGESSYWGLEGREHTAQVSQKQREWREWRFRFEEEDIEHLNNSGYRDEIKASGESDQFLPALFCSPTMELGVDISALNAVYLRNVPPTPANYAQRAGRSGRSGQAAVVVTYCASGSPHDQYFFERRNDMVAGVVRPPALDITNEELIRSHLHAVWLAETKLALSPDIPEILDLQDESRPLKTEILDVISKPELASRSRLPMKRVLDQILENGEVPVWMGEPEEFVEQISKNAPRQFDQAFDRWRSLYNSARKQLAEANARSEIPGLPRKDRSRIKSAQIQASDQISLLEQGNASNGSDFYSYRYLATEGFLPGYNFPRLPLYAFVPGEGKRGAYLSRARFLAISEFGPRSLIYHEGRAYRVISAKLPPEARQGDGAELATKDIYICSNCGASHEEEVECCHGCGENMAGEVPVTRTLRIDNVEAAPAERITANDEERVRQGFEIQTVFSWPKKDGQVQVMNAEFRCGETPLLTLQYANSAEISRLNKGLKRRKDQTVFGFHINPRTGYWAKAPDENPEPGDPPDAVQPVRVVPIVKDRKNALLFRFEAPESFAQETITTVQHALMRGIEVVFQLEEGEILGEPLPARDNRRAILAYEATEGGAGVLARLMDDSQAISKVARTALELMHFQNIEAAIVANDPKLLTEKEHESCVRGCYRCLLSYFNQPDQEQIDRSSEEVTRFLINLGRGETVLERPVETDGSHSPWLRVFEQAELPQVDTMPASFAGTEVEFVWRGYLVAATTHPVSPEMSADAKGKGWELVLLPSTPGDIPDPLISLLKG
jgi:superfamily II DNA/RNA helicase